MGRFHHDCSSHEEKSLSDRSRHLGAVAGEDQVYSNLGPEHAQATCFHGTIGVGWGSDLEAFDAVTYPHIQPDAIHGEVEGQGPQGQAYTTYLLRQNMATSYQNSLYCLWYDRPAIQIVVFIGQNPGPKAGFERVQRKSISYS
jgi:hypothetical protein